ncbi:MAG: SAM-dependent methyltransferase [Candidatus Aenigmarchaeota archaeon]|nr:SAM-dependent methyltransferase [Candidatus Aenigmarchaeota archaeon]
MMQEKNPIVFKIPPYKDILGLLQQDDIQEPISHEVFANLKNRLNTSKTKMDGIPTKKYTGLATKLDVYNGLRKFVEVQFNAQRVSNAWLKIYELMSIFTPITKKNPYIFCNAELPGAFLLGLNHYIRAPLPHTNYEWVASSLISDDKKSLGDFYGLYRKYNEKWLMDLKQGLNGDVTEMKTIKHIAKYFATRKVDLYTSDLGMDVSADYNKQEDIHMHANLGQILSGLISVDIGGSFITKQYTFFETFTLNLIVLLSGMFREFYICKPLTSRPLNSEIYLVGLGFIGAPGVIAVLTDRLREKNLSPIFSLTPAVEQIRIIAEAGNAIFGRQADLIDKYIELSLMPNLPRMIEFDASFKKEKEKEFCKKYDIKWLDRKLWI